MVGLVCLIKLHSTRLQYGFCSGRYNPRRRPHEQERGQPSGLPRINMVRRAPINHFKWKLSSIISDSHTKLLSFSFHDSLPPTTITSPTSMQSVRQCSENSNHSSMFSLFSRDSHLAPVHKLDFPSSSFSVEPFSPSSTRCQSSENSHLTSFYSIESFSSCSRRCRSSLISQFTLHVTGEWFSSSTRCRSSENSHSHLSTRLSRFLRRRYYLDYLQTIVVNHLPFDFLSPLSAFFALRDHIDVLLRIIVSCLCFDLTLPLQHIVSTRFLRSILAIFSSSRPFRFSSDNRCQSSLYTSLFLFCVRLSRFHFDLSRAVPFVTSFLEAIDFNCLFVIDFLSHLSSSLLSVTI